MKIATWNVNSINVRKNHLLGWLKDKKPDIVLLQEIKCENDKFPREAIEELGYNLAVAGQKGFNGVAILSLFPIDEFITTLDGSPLPEHSRYIEAVISIKGAAIRVASVYVPNGEDLESDKYPLKLKFFDALKAHMKNLLDLDEYLVIGGDFNVAPEDIDNYDPISTQGSVLFSLEVRKKFRSLLNLGFYNAYRLVNPHGHQFSWWDYRGGSWQRNKGMLIDHILLSPKAADKLQLTEIDEKLRGAENPSDHVPLICELSL